MEKKVKISLSSTNEELLSTMIHEGKNVDYWHKKHYGGPRKYDKWQDEQLAKVQTMPPGTELVGEMIDYHSLATGNRWKSFEVTTLYSHGNAYTRFYKFCYWDTYGSVGAFYKCEMAGTGVSHLLVFPSHFFLRYADRMGIKHRDAALVCEFFNHNHVFATNVSNDPDDEGRRQFIIAAKEGVCYGFLRTHLDNPEDFYKNDSVFEVRTFLRYEQLTPRQLKECQPVRELAEDGRLTDGSPMVHSIGRAMADEEYAKKVNDAFARSLGLNEEQMEACKLLFEAVVHTSDFVSGEYRNFMSSLIEGRDNDKVNAECSHLMDIIASHIRDDKDYVQHFGYNTMLSVTHEWKGDDYDWNKWLFGLLCTLIKTANEPDFIKWADNEKNRCARHEYTYHDIDELTKKFDRQN